MDVRPLIYRVLELGGHVQVGLELHFDPNYKPTNIELLQEIIDMAKEVKRPVATPEQANALLGTNPPWL